MWALANKTPYGAERLWWRDKAGAHHWLVAVQATFAAQGPRDLGMAEEQPPPLLALEHMGEPGLSSLLREADLVPPKPTTDVLVKGHAHAPQGKPATSVLVGLRVHNLARKTLMVFGPRVYYRGLVGQTSVSSPRPFVTRPVVYEGAFGGLDTSHPDPKKHAADMRNPVGRGIAAAAREHEEAHWIEFPGTDPRKAGPAGFGPIDRHWLPRIRYAGTYDAAWAKNKKPLLPDDYDDRFAVCAPADQAPPSPLRGGERIELVNMTPEGVWAFELPKIFPTFATYFGRRHEEHRSRLATVFIDADRKVVSLVWLTSLRVRARDVDYLDETRIGEKAYLP